MTSGSLHEVQGGGNLAKKTQSEKFKVAAKEAEADLDEAAFKKRLGKIARAHPSTQDTPHQQEKTKPKG